MVFVIGCRTREESKVSLIGKQDIFRDIRVRIDEYSPGYLADHWCNKGHCLYCKEGELHTELEDGRIFF